MSDIQKYVQTFIKKRKFIEPPESKRPLKRIKLSNEEVTKKQREAGGKKRVVASKKPEGKKSNHETMSRDKVVESIQELNVAITGARPGEIIMGCSKGTTGGCIVRLSSDSGIIKPHWGRIIGICQYDDLKEKFLVSLEKIPFFAAKSIEERYKWIAENSSKVRDYDIASEPGAPVRLQIISVGGKLLSDLVDPEMLDEMLKSPDAHHLEAKIIYSLFSKKTLFWLRQMWKISIMHKLISETKLLVLDTISCQLCYDGYSIRDSTQEMFEINYQLGKLAIVVDKANNDTNPTITLANCLDWFHQHEFVKNVSKKVQQACRALFEAMNSSLTLAFFKSEYQKMVRLPAEETVDFTDFADDVARFHEIRHKEPLNVDKADFMIPVPYALLMCMSQIVCHSGIFVPTIQKFVTGLESFLRRTIIIKAEDAHVTSQDLETMFSMAACLLLAQRVPSWKPTMNQAKTWFTLGLESLFQRKCLGFDTRKGNALPPFKLLSSKKLNRFEAISAILDDGGMEGDHGMLRYLAKYGKFEDSKESKEHKAIPGPKSIKGYCAIDQHCAADFIYFYPDLKELATKVDHRTKKTFGPFLTQEFQQCSGVNLRRTLEFKNKPERTWTPEFESRPFVKNCRFAQFAYMKRMLEQPPELKNSAFEKDIVSVFRVNYELDVGWLACGVGPIYFKKKELEHLIVTMDAEHPQELIVSRKPVRGATQDVIPNNEQNLAIAEARRMLIYEGIPWFRGKNHAHPPMQEWNGGKVFFHRDTESYMIHLLKPAGEKQEMDLTDDSDEEEKVIKLKPSKFLPPVPWEEMRQIKIKIPMCKTKDLDRMSILTAPNDLGNYIQVDAMSKISSLVASMSTSTIRAVKTLLIGFNSKIEMGRIAMDGASTAQPVTLADVHAFQFMCELCVLVPAAIKHELRSPTRFVVTNGPLLWHIRDTIIYEVARKRILELNRGNEMKRYDWPKSTDSKRVMREYQQDVLHEVTSKAEAGQIFHILHMTVGSGKSLVSIRFVQHAIEDLSAPIKYIIVIVPNEVSAEAVREWELEGFADKIDIVLPIKKVSEQATKTWGKKIHHIPDETQTLRPGRVSIIDYNHLKQLQTRLLALAPEAIFVFDEMHKIVEEKTLRTNICQRLASNAYSSIGMTGTLVIDADTHRIVIWLRYILNWHVTEGNFMVAVSAIVSKLAPPDAKCVSFELNGEWPTPEMETEYKSLVSPMFGGIRDRPNGQHHAQALELCYSASLINLAKNVKLWFEKSDKLAWFSSPEHKVVTQEQGILGNGLFCIVKDNRQVDQLIELVTKGEFKSVTPNQVRKIEVGASFRLTDEEVEAKKVPDYRLVIAPQSKILGYHLGRLAGIMTAVWPSNLSTRDQGSGRVARQGQRRKFIPVIRTAIGIQDLIRTGKHASAQGLLNSLTIRADKI